MLFARPSAFNRVTACIYVRAHACHVVNASRVETVRHSRQAVRGNLYKQQYKHKQPRDVHKTPRTAWGPCYTCILWSSTLRQLLACLLLSGPLLLVSSSTSTQQTFEICKHGSSATKPSLCTSITNAHYRIHGLFVGSPLTMPPCTALRCRRTTCLRLSPTIPRISQASISSSPDLPQHRTSRDSSSYI